LGRQSFAADISYFGEQAQSYANPFLSRKTAPGFGNVNLPAPF